MAALGDAVIYSRSKNTEAGGLSVYHPYENKKKYLESWQNDYRLLNFSAEYNRYLEHFGAILTGESYVDWSRLSPEYGTMMRKGETLSLIVSTGPEEQPEQARVENPMCLFRRKSWNGCQRWHPSQGRT